MDNNTLYLIINCAIVLLLLVGFIVGCKKGLIYEICSFLLNFVVIFVAYKLCGTLSKQIPLVNLDDISFGLDGIDLLNINLTELANQLIWFLIIFLGAKLLFFIISPLIKAFSKIPLIGPINKLFGGLLGGIEVLIILILASAILKFMPINTEYQITDNTFLKYTDNITDWVSGLIVNNFVNSDTVTIDSSITNNVTEYLNSLDENSYQTVVTYLTSLDEDDYASFVTTVNSMSNVLGNDIVSYVNSLDENSYKTLLTIFKAMNNMDLNSFIKYIESLSSGI